MCEEPQAWIEKGRRVVYCGRIARRLWRQRRLEVLMAVHRTAQTVVGMPALLQTMHSTMRSDHKGAPNGFKVPAQLIEPRPRRHEFVGMWGWSSRSFRCTKSSCSWLKLLDPHPYHESGGR